jgi:hypothetical protein
MPEEPRPVRGGRRSREAGTMLSPSVRAGPCCAMCLNRWPQARPLVTNRLLHYVGANPWTPRTFVSTRFGAGRWTPSRALTQVGSAGQLVAKCTNSLPDHLLLSPVLATPQLFTRAQSDITSIRRRHEEERALSPERGPDQERGHNLSSVLEEIAEGEQAVARPYLAWACSQLGVDSMYTEFQRRAVLRDGSGSEGDKQEEEEEYSLDEMIEDVEITRAASLGSDSGQSGVDSSPSSPTRTAASAAPDMMLE